MPPDDVLAVETSPGSCLVDGADTGGRGYEWEGESPPSVSVTPSGAAAESRGLSFRQGIVHGEIAAR